MKLWKKCIGLGIVLMMTIVSLSGCIVVDRNVSKVKDADRLEITEKHKRMVADLLDVKQENVDSAVEDLNIQLYGVNDKSRGEVMQVYEKSHSDWNLVVSKSNEYVVLKAWKNTVNNLGHVVAVSDHSKIKRDSEYGCVFVTSHSDLFTYREYLEKIR